MTATRTLPKPGDATVNNHACIGCGWTAPAGEGIYLDGMKVRHANGCPSPLTTREVAAAIGVAPRTKHFQVLDREWGTPISYDGSRTEFVLATLATHSYNRIPEHDRRNRCALIAAALHKSMTTGRMNPTSCLRIKAYTPYQLCALVAKISRECRDSQLGEICDYWIGRNHASL